jgi:hypothetical protein
LYVTVDTPRSTVWIKICIQTSTNHSRVQKSNACYSGLCILVTNKITWRQLHTAVKIICQSIGIAASTLDSSTTFWKP